MNCEHDLEPWPSQRSFLRRPLARSPKMTESCSPIRTHDDNYGNDGSSNSNSSYNNNTSSFPEIPIEIVSEEEMALLDGALSAARSSLFSSPTSSQFRRNARSIESITLNSKRRLTSCCSGTSTAGDIEDLGSSSSTQKRVRLNESLLWRFRRKKGLSVTDITATEWCEKQKEFQLLLGKREITKAMKAGSARHVILEEEVIKKVKVRTESVEDAWAIKFLNFFVGANQLLFEGLTRELPLIGFVDGVWLVGLIDEIRMPATGIDRNPILVETKTRVQASLPAEPQRRNGRLQLMCYKLLWDNLVADKFPSQKFFDFFSLNPHYILSEEIRKSAANLAFPAETLDDLVRSFRNTCSILPPAHDELLLRPEFHLFKPKPSLACFGADTSCKKIIHCLVKIILCMTRIGFNNSSKAVLSSGWESEKPGTQRRKKIGNVGFVSLLQFVLQTPIQIYTKLGKML